MTLSANSTRTGIDLTWVDADVRPQDDLFTHVNGRWLATHEIPEDRAQDGTFVMLRDRAEADVRAIVEGAAEQVDDDARRIAALYASFMDVERVEALGVEPLRPLLDEIAAAPDHTALARVLGRRQREGRASLIGSFVSTDAKDPSRYLVHLNQSGLGLPDESYYRDESYAEIRTAYLAHLERMAELVGLPEPAQLAEAVMALETALAAASWDRVTNRDAEKTYTLLTAAELRERAPAFAWDAWLDGLGAPEGAFAEVVVRQPSFVEAAATLWHERPLAQWQAWLQLRTASACADFLSDAVVQQDFAFYGRTLSGTPQIKDRWKRGVALVEASVGEAVGRLYVAAALPGVVQGADDGARREPRRGLPAEHLHAGLDGPGHPRAGAGEARQVHPQDRLPGQVGGLLGARGRAPTTCWATCCAPAPGSPTASSTRSASRSTAPSGS